MRRRMATPVAMQVAIQTKSQAMTDGDSGGQNESRAGITSTKENTANVIAAGWRDDTGVDGKRWFTLDIASDEPLPDQARSTPTELLAARVALRELGKRTFGEHSQPRRERLPPQ